MDAQIKRVLEFRGCHLQVGATGVQSTRAIRPIRGPFSPQGCRALTSAGRVGPKYDAVQMGIDDVIARWPGKYDDAVLQMIDSL